MSLFRSALALTALLVALPAQATVLHAWSLEERIARADNVVVGTVTAQQAHRVDGRIFTDTTIKVERTIFGPARSELTVTQLGGTIGESTLEIAGSAHFTIGDHVVVIVRVDAAGRAQLVGMSLGAFAVSGRRARQNINVPLMRGDGRLLDAPGEQVLDLDRINAAASDVRRTLERAAAP